MRITTLSFVATVAAIIAGTCLTSQSVGAQVISDQEKLKKFLNSPNYVNKLRAIVSRYELRVSGCKTPKVSGRITAKVLKTRLAMPGIGLPKSMQWVDVVRIEGCGKPFGRKVIATVKDGQAVFFPYLSGSTKTTPKLQFETMRHLLTKERTRSTKAGCEKNSPLILNTTKFVAEAKVETGTMWREAWTVTNCKGKRVVGVLFVPDASGKSTITIE